MSENNTAAHEPCLSEVKRVGLMLQTSRRCCLHVSINGLLLAYLDLRHDASLAFPNISRFYSLPSSSQYHWLPYHILPTQCIGSFARVVAVNAPIVVRSSLLCRASVEVVEARTGTVFSRY